MLRQIEIKYKNIYFAKAALKIGADQLMQSLNQIGFNQELPFDIVQALINAVIAIAFLY